MDSDQLAGRQLLRVGHEHPLCEVEDVGPIGELGGTLSRGEARVHCAAMTVDSLPWPSRVWLSWVAAFRILFDGAFAARVADLRDAKAAELPEPVRPSSPVMTEGADALQLLSLLQREGRFVDFVEQDITAFSDQDVGAAARVVHEGCRRALHAHARIESVRGEAEGSRVTLEQADRSVKLVGSVAGSAPYRGVLRHRGWRVQELKLPTRIGEHDPKLLAPAELELS